VPLRFTFTAKDGSDFRTLWISLPPNLDVPAGGSKSFVVGHNGETFTIPWPPPDAPSTTDETLASEWVEMWVHATAFRTVGGEVSVDPTYPQR
jgi:hypothetical protein